MSIKVGILGGAFDPVHLGHLELAKEAIQKFSLDKFIFIPTYLHPFKGKDSYIFNFDQRIELLNEAIQVHFNKEEKSIISINPIEESMPGENYTIHTLKYLKSENAEWEIYFIIGTDNLEHLKYWFGVNELLNICKLVSFHRKGYAIENIKAIIKKDFEPLVYEKIVNGIFEANIPEISSSQIRKNLETNNFQSKHMLQATSDHIKKILKK